MNIENVKVGDVVEAIDERYGCTCKSANWIGVVCEVEEDSNRFNARTISADWGSSFEEKYSYLRIEHFRKREDLMTINSGDIVKLKSVTMFKEDISAGSTVFGKKTRPKFTDTKGVLLKEGKELTDSWKVLFFDESDNSLRLEVGEETFWVNSEYFYKVGESKEVEEITECEEAKVGVSIKLKEVKEVLDFNAGDFLVLENGDLVTVVKDYDGSGYRAFNLTQGIATRCSMIKSGILNVIRDKFEEKVVRVVPAKNIEIIEK